MDQPLTVPISAWRSYLDEQEKLLPRQYRADTPEELMMFLLDGRCDASQIGTVEHLCDFLRELERLRPLLLRFRGDIVRCPRQPVRGQAYVVVESGIEKAAVVAAMQKSSEIVLRSPSLSERLARIQAVALGQSRLFLEAADNSSVKEGYLRRMSELNTPFLDMHNPHATSIRAALTKAIEENIPDPG